MTKENFLKMDDFMALSWINTKLRDEYCSLNFLCEDFHFDEENVVDKFKRIDYIYIKEQNRFI